MVVVVVVVMVVVVMVVVVMALSCAAIDDVLAWCILALASSFAQSATSLMGLYTCIGAVAYIAAMLVVLKPLLSRLHSFLLKRLSPDSPPLNSNRYYVSFIYLLLLASAFTTEGLGIHCFFGAFVMGFVLPKEGGFAAGLSASMETVVAAIFFMACFAKLTPTTVLTKLLLGKSRGWRFCVAMGFLMNTRGLVQLIALNIALNLGILSPRMFTMFVLMAVATTWTTSPAIWLLYRKRQHELKDEPPTAAGPDELIMHDRAGSSFSAAAGLLYDASR
eukprot:gene6946-7164_t